MSEWLIPDELAATLCEEESRRSPMFELMLADARRMPRVKRRYSRPEERIVSAAEMLSLYEDAVVARDSWDD
jgi:hypothetical protein